MSNFRFHTPTRRNITEIVAKYSDHKPNLKIDFLSRCGYCNAPDSWKTAFYEVDHFIPVKRNKKIFLTIKSHTDYSNLVYSCRSCNNAKRNKWPTDDQNVSHKNDQGFVDPCDKDYLTHFDRDQIGNIVALTNLGRWMYLSMNLHKPHHKVIWQLEQLEPVIKQIKENDKLHILPEHIKDRIIKLFVAYDNYRDELRNL
ncbi:HNH endonuclease [Flavobacterium sp. HBTb2-11-1]|uniref:HNH endonuclease n=1 Tax=Flavobacterium sp. HBTb2-11-1 TaxID=2692212 RepID=UPI001370CD66|nr:HNH endonuclease signature motif containing protein [Flavobacterium sp. HBTb2-11-1]MXO04371.1 HNH endonuclease [Flavobacterium sp. HBTb2-11-1]